MRNETVIQKMENGQVIGSPHSSLMRYNIGIDESEAEYVFQSTALKYVHLITNLIYLT